MLEFGQSGDGRLGFALMKPVMEEVGNVSVPERSSEDEAPVSALHDPSMPHPCRHAEGPALDHIYISPVLILNHFMHIHHMSKD